MTHAFLEALETEDAEKVGQAYMSLRAILLSDSSLDPSAYITSQDVSNAMRLLSQTSYINDDFSVLRKMYQDLPSLWHVDELSDADHSSYFQALMSSGRWALARHLLAGKGSGSIARWKPSSDIYNTYLRAYSQSKGRSFQATRKWALTEIPADKRDLQTYTILLEAFSLSMPNKKDMKELVQWIQQQCTELKLDNSQQERLKAAVLAAYITLRDMDAAQQTYEELVPKGKANEAELSEQVIIALVRYDVISGDLQSARRRCQVATQERQAIRRELTKQLFEDLARARGDACVWSLEDLRSHLNQVESATGLLPDFPAYEHAMRLAVSFENALAMARDAHRDGISLSSGMLRAAVSKVPTGQASVEHTEALKVLYSDLASSKLSDSRSQDGIHNSALYITLLQYCARRDVADLDWATSLMDDIKAHGLAILSSDRAASASDWQSSGADATVPTNIVATTSAASIVIALMKNAAQDHSQAFKAYSWMWAIDQDNIFSKQDWYDILRTYTELRFKDENGGAKLSYVPSSIFFAFFEDMRKVGIPPDSPIYQVVLQYYAEEGGASPKSSADAVRVIHSLIKMDHYYDPDIGLMNRLMYAYSKTGDTEAAVGVWRSILINRIPFNNVSISIILDTYGYLGRYDKVVKLWEALEARGFPQQLHSVNKKNFESFIEALCRTGRVDEAVQKTLDALKAPESVVDEDTITILLKFARSKPQTFHRLRDQIAKEHSKFWPMVKDVGVPKAVIGPKSSNSGKVDFRASEFARVEESNQGDAAIKPIEPSHVSFQKS